MKKPRRGDVVEVEWLDSQHVALGWAPTKSYLDATARPQSYRTAGYYIGATSGHVVIALSLDPANRHMTHAMTIPEAVVARTTVLGRATKRVRKALRP